MVSDSVEAGGGGGGGGESSSEEEDDGNGVGDMGGGGGGAAARAPPPVLVHIVTLLDGLDFTTTFNANALNTVAGSLAAATAPPTAWKGGTPFNVTALVTSPYAELYVDGIPADGGSPLTVVRGTATVWQVHGNPSNLTVVGLGERCQTGPGREISSSHCNQGPLLTNTTRTTPLLGKHTVLRPTTATCTRLQLQVDVPAITTGTGSKLLADGEDAALIRVSLVDANGILCSAQDPLAGGVRVTFSVAKGPGRVVGAASGDPAVGGGVDLPSGTNAVYLYGGMASVVVRVTLDCVSPHRDTILAVDAEGLIAGGVGAGAGAGAGVTVVPVGQHCPLDAIEIAASAMLPSGVVRCYSLLFTIATNLGQCLCLLPTSSRFLEQKLCSRMHCSLEFLLGLKAPYVQSNGMC
jgi:hypothetical protein